MAEPALDSAPEPSRLEMPGMTLLEHLEELRKRIIYSLISVVVAFGLAWGYAERIFRLMEIPIKEALRANHLSEKLVYTSPTDPFNIYLRIALIAGLFLASPVILYQFWMFISPGLYRHEKRYVVPFMFVTVGLFLAGGYFGYRYVYPAALTFLIDYGKDFQPMITVGEYTDLFLTVVAGMGVVFELPTVIFFLALMGVVDAKFLVNNFRYAILIIFLVAAILTPTTDLVNLCMFAAPMVVLYILSIGVAWLVHPKRRRKVLEAQA
ncbi:MAG TPA: twin-arginine translocase subunit TatC [Terriglobales bacterium]|nr:twin-arginine translocase subunit TatC [Terriglobales bacterium]